MNKGYIRLIMRGTQNASKWLVGAEFVKNAQVLKVLQVTSSDKEPNLSFNPIEDRSHEIQCLIKKAEEFHVKFPYTKTVEALFLDKAKRCKVIVWPGSVNPIHFSNEAAIMNLSVGEFQGSVDDSNLSASCGTYITGPPVTHLNSTFANSCWRALESTEPHNGYGMLVNMEASINLKPNRQLNLYLSDFLENGPRHENVKIMELYRTEVSVNVIKYHE